MPEIAADPPSPPCFSCFSKPELSNFNGLYLISSASAHALEGSRPVFNPSFTIRGQAAWETRAACAMNIGDVMTPDVEVVTPGDTLSTAARIMAQLDSDVLPVGENNKLVGIITGRDIAIRVAAEGRNAEEVVVGEAMSTDILYCFAEERVEDVAFKMGAWWIRRLPVVGQDRRLLGTVALGDLIPSKPHPPDLDEPAAVASAI
jgi:CBS domain-containing protein